MPLKMVGYLTRRRSEVKFNKNTRPISTQLPAGESMTALKNTGLHIVILFVLQTLWLGTAYSQLVGIPKYKEEVSKQEGIYQSRGEKTPEGYVIDRSLLAYTFTLPAEFDHSLASLVPTDRWLDIGAGQGQAVLDYYASRYDAMHVEGQERRGRKAQAVAISIEDRRTALWSQTAASLEPNQIQYFFGKRLGEYSLKELGQFQLITDLLGGFSYTESISRFMEKVLGFLALNGSFYTILQDVNSEKGTNKPYYPNARFLTEIENSDGSELKICSWLKRITCVKVTCELKPEWKPPVEVYRIHKVCDDVAVPALVPVHFEAGTPPERRFQMGKPLQVAPGQTNTTGGPEKLERQIK
jgi:SAM-dependent methyltransferase